MAGLRRLNRNFRARVARSNYEHPSGLAAAVRLTLGPTSKRVGLLAPGQPGQTRSRTPAAEPSDAGPSGDGFEVLGGVDAVSVVLVLRRVPGSMRSSSGLLASAGVWPRGTSLCAAEHGVDAQPFS